MLVLESATFNTMRREGLLRSFEDVVNLFLEAEPYADSDRYELYSHTFLSLEGLTWTVELEKCYPGTFNVYMFILGPPITFFPPICYDQYIVRAG